MNLDDILISKLDRIAVEGGDVLHAMKATDSGFLDFGEAYFSMISFKAIKAWKLHHKMTLNLVVPLGRVLFVFKSDDSHFFREEVIGGKDYKRITVPPGIWFGFQGLEKEGSLILNIADISHDPNEVSRLNISELDYLWKECI